MDVPKTKDEGPSASLESVVDVPIRFDPLSDQWARALGLASIIIAVGLGFKAEILSLVSTPSFQVDLQESPALSTRSGFLRASFFVIIKSSGMKDTAIEGAELELKHSDGTVILMPALARQAMSSTQVFSVPFKGLTAKANQPIVEYVSFEEKIPEGLLNSILAIEYKLSASLHAKIIPESVEGYTDPAKLEAMKRAEPPSIEKPAKVKRTPSGIEYFPSYKYTTAYTYTYTTTSSVAAYSWTADEVLRKEATQLFDANYRFRPGSYVATINVFGPNKSMLVSKRYLLTILESQSSAVREAWERFNGRRYAKEPPPVRDISFTLRSAD